MSPALQPVSSKWSGWVLSGLFLIVAVLLFVALYVTITGNEHFWALIAIGIFALLFAVGCYFMEAFSRDPSAQRSLAWGFFGMGFAVLILSIGLGPSYGVLSLVAQLWGLIIVIVALAVSVGLIAWRTRSVTATQNQMVSRGSWQRETAPSAFSYAAANSPSVPATAPPPPNSGGSPPPRSP